MQRDGSMGATIVQRRQCHLPGKIVLDLMWRHMWKTKNKIKQNISLIKKHQKVPLTAFTLLYNKFIIVLVGISVIPKN